MKRFLNYILKNIIRIKSKFIYSQELKNIKKFINSKSDEIYFVFDLSSSPIRIGNFIAVIALARYFLLKKKKIRFFLIKEKKLKLYKKLSSKKTQEYFLNFKKILKVFLNNRVNLEFVKFKSFLKIKNNKTNFILFEKRILNRKRIDIYCCYLINYLVKLEGKKFLKKYLISKDSFRKFNYKRLNKIKKIKYNTLQIRFDKTFDNNRNISKERLISVIKFIFNKEKLKNLFIISDKDGCNFAKKIIHSLKFKKNIFYSRDYGNDIINDSILLFWSNKNFNTHYSGGIQLLSAFSQHSFEDYSYLSPITRYQFLDTVSQEKYFSWQFTNQKVFNFFGGKHIAIKKKLYTS